MGLLVLGCASNDKKHSEKIYIETQSSKTVNVSDLFDIKNKTVLKLPDSILVGVINEMIINNKRIYLLDKYQSKSIVCFDFMGNFLFQLKSTGKGPGEFAEIELMQVDSINNSLIVYDRSLGKIITYDLDELKVEQEITHTPYLNYIGFTKNGNILYVTDEYENSDSDFEYLNLISDFRNFSDKIFSFKTNIPAIIEGADSRVFFEYGNDIYYIQSFTNILYRFDDNGYYPILDIDFSNEVKENQYSGNPQDVETILYNSNYSFYPHRGNLKDSTLSFFFYNSIDDVQFLVLNLANKTKYTIYSSVKNDWYKKAFDIPLYSKQGIYYNILQIDELSPEEASDLLNQDSISERNNNGFILIGYSLKN